MTIEQSLRGGVDAFNRHDAAGFAAMYAADAVINDPQYPEPLRGRAAAEADMKSFFAAFPDVRADLSRVFVDGDYWALELVMSGTHNGPMEGPTGTVPPTGKKMSLPGAMAGRVNAQGEVVEERRYYDLAGLMGQLGLMG